MYTKLLNRNLFEAASRVLIACATLFGPLAAAKEVRLFNSAGQQIENYETALEQAEAGDQFCFGRNCKYRFEISDQNWHGGTTKIFLARRVFADGSRSQELALRVPLKSGSTSYAAARHVTPFTEYISLFVRGHRKLKLMGGVDLPQIHWNYRDQFAAVEYIKFQFKLDEFFLNRGKFPPEVLAQAEQALYRFVERTVHYKDISDFYSGTQLVYEAASQRWILIDWIYEDTQFMPLISRDSYDGLSPMGWRNILYIYNEVDKLKNEDERGEGRRILANVNNIIRRNTSNVWIRTFNFCNRVFLRN